MPVKKRKTKKASNAEEKARKRQHKLNSIKNEFEARRIASFEQVFAIMAPTNIAAELKMGFATLEKRCANPGDFTLQELINFSELLNVDIDIIIQFVFTVMRYKRPVAGKTV